MEKEIKQLVELANRYKYYGATALLETHKIINLGNKTAIYFGDTYDTCSVSFNFDTGKEIDVVLFNSQICLPFTCTVELLEATYNEYLLHIEALEANVKADRDRVVRKRVENLKNEIKLLTAV